MPWCTDNDIECAKHFFGGLHFKILTTFFLFSVNLFSVILLNYFIKRIYNIHNFIHFMLLSSIYGNVFSSSQHSSASVKFTFSFHDTWKWNKNTHLRAAHQKLVCRQSWNEITHPLQRHDYIIAKIYTHLFRPMCIYFMSAFKSVNQ